MPSPRGAQEIAPNRSKRAGPLHNICCYTRVAGQMGCFASAVKDHRSSDAEPSQAGEARSTTLE
eukprot:10325741-Alexandrium_andersonii.AAC.1